MIDDYLHKFIDMRECEVGITKKDKKIDRIFTNVGRSVVESGTWPPLETDADFDGRTTQSDYRVAFCKIELQKVDSFIWREYSYRRYTEEAEEKFKQWLVMHEWNEVLNAYGPNGKAGAYQAYLNWAIEEFFPLKTTRKKSIDLSWLGRGVRKLIKNRKRLFVSEGCQRT